MSIIEVVTGLTKYNLIESGNIRDAHGFLSYRINCVLCEVDETDLV